jgi:hypothetical protein
LALPPFLNNILGWLRAGYPDGVPESDYVPLLALLTRRLSDDEVGQITAALVEHGDIPIDKASIGVLITKITNELPLQADIDRVHCRLREGGWIID